MKRLAIFPLLFSLALPISAQSAGSSAERPPNFLPITADDLSWDSLVGHLLFAFPGVMREGSRMKRMAIIAACSNQPGASKRETILGVVFDLSADGKDFLRQNFPENLVDRLDELRK